jgi:hypothetical protein
VVLAFVLTALTTTIASIVAAFLDASLDDDKAFFPKRLQAWIHRDLSDAALEKRRLWRCMLDRLILGLADQQLVSGFALLVCGYLAAYPEGVAYYDSADLAHWNLIVYMACLSSSTHLACVLTLRKYFNQHKETGTVRIVFIILFSLFLIPSIIMSYCFEAFLIPITLLADHEIEKKGTSVARINLVTGLWYTFQAVAYIYLFYAAVMQLLPGYRQKIKQWKIWSLLRRLCGINMLSAFFEMVSLNHG